MGVSALTSSGVYHTDELVPDHRGFVLRRDPPPLLRLLLFDEYWDGEE